MNAEGHLTPGEWSISFVVTAYRRNGSALDLEGTAGTLALTQTLHGLLEAEVLLRHDTMDQRRITIPVQVGMVLARAIEMLRDTRQRSDGEQLIIEFERHLESYPAPGNPGSPA